MSSFLRTPFTIGRALALAVWVIALYAPPHTLGLGIVKSLVAAAVFFVIWASATPQQVSEPLTGAAAERLVATRSSSAISSRRGKAGSVTERPPLDARLRRWWWRFNHVCIRCGHAPLDNHGCMCPLAQTSRRLDSRS